MVLLCLVRRWMNGKGLTSPRVRQTATRPAGCRPRLHLEALEDRCVPSTVMNLLDSGPGSLRQAILDTPSGGTVDFQPGLTGTITLTSGELLIGQDLTIAGPGASVITVSGNNASRVFDIGAAATVGVSGLTVANGNVVDGNGGGISNNGTLTVSACIVTDNTALDDTGLDNNGNGGGISNSGTLTVSNSTISNNSAQDNADLVFGSESSGNGGGISSTGTLTVRDSTISNNSAQNNIFFGSGLESSGNGGGISSNGTLSITSTTVSNNSARNNDFENFIGSGNGGGISSSGTLSITSTTVSNNSAQNNPLFVFGSEISGNGGGISSNGTLTVRDSTISNNSAQNNIFFGQSESSGNGGGISSSGTLSITSTTVSNNSAQNNDQQSFASGNGGGISSNGPLTVSNSTLGGNSLSGAFSGGSSTGSAIFSDGDLNLSGTALSGNSGGSITVSYGDGEAATITGCSLTSNPAGLACVGGNGTLTVRNSTIADNGNYGVWNGSTATVSDSTIAGNAGYGFRNDGTLTVSNSTIAGNSLGGIENIAFTTDATALLVSSTVAFNGGHQFYSASGFGVPRATATVQLGNTIVAGDGSSANLAAGPAGTFSSQGYNLSSDDGGGYLTGPGDLTNTDPLLGPLQDNGGPTETMALLAGSPALNAGDPAQLGVADQRGVVRSGGVNIGAYQASASAFVLTAPAQVTAGAPFNLVVTAVDVFGQTAVGYRGTVTFSSSDKHANLPADYTFTAADGGTHTFSGVSFSFYKLGHGQQSITVTDTAVASIFGSIDVAVQKPPHSGE